MRLVCRREQSARLCLVSHLSHKSRHAVSRVRHSMSPVTDAWAADTGADLAKTNVNGSAIAIGHPLGASGARIMTTLVNALHQRGGRYGLQTMCEGGGMANATIVERLG
jgi:acetyl-CoA acyltransferase